ncbi:MAG: hypothetical protein ACLVLH_12385 [Eisenbergiella massiliensis]
MRRKADIAFQEMEAEILKVIKQDPESTEKLKEILGKAKERMVQEE